MNSYKCRKCRTILFTSDNVVDAHGDGGDEPKGDKASRECVQFAGDIIFLGEQSTLPEWMRAAIDEADWTKGRLTCPTDMCLARVGGFNYITPGGCRCSLRKRLPNIQISRSRVDEPATVGSTE